MAKRSITNPLEVELELDSSAGNNIPNVQNWHTFSDFDAQRYEVRFRTAHGNIVERTKGCTFVYNCHGLVFAARRTTIYDAATVRKILFEDSYQEIPRDKVLPGDVILYIHTEGDIPHSGIVLETKTLIPGNFLVLGKWGPWAEVIHYAFQCPYLEPDVSIEYRRRIVKNVE